MQTVSPQAVGARIGAQVNRFGKFIRAYPYQCAGAVGFLWMVAPGMVRSSTGWLETLAVVFAVLYVGFLGTSMLLVLALLAGFVATDYVVWVRNAPARRIGITVAGIAVVIVIGWAGSYLGLGQEGFCEPNPMGGEICFDP